MFKQKFNETADEVPDGEKIVLDRATFRALASDTRVEILKELDKRRKTLTELSDSVGLAVATIKEHISSLSASGLVEVKDEGRKWKYYELTEKGKAVLYPERRKIWVMIAALFFAVILSGYMSFYDIGYIGGRDIEVSPTLAGVQIRHTESPAARTMDQEIQVTEAPEEIDEYPEPENDMGIFTATDDEEPHVDAEPSTIDDRLSFGDHVLSLPLFRYISYIAVLAVTSKIIILGMRYSRKKSSVKKKSKRPKH